MWAEGWLKHKTVSQQHNRTMRGIKGKPQVGVGLSIDFNPQLTIRARIDDPETLQAIKDKKIRSASLEFLPLEHKDVIEGESIIEHYHVLSSEPEHCSVTVCDIGAVPGATITERSLPANWQYADIDPLVLNGQISDPEQIAQLRWFDHHNPTTHMIDPEKLERAVAELEAGSFFVPEFASRTREDVIRNARAHLSRHVDLGIGSARTQGGNEVNQWIKARTQQLMLERGISESQAKAAAQAEWNSLDAQVRARVTGQELPTEELSAALVGEARESVTININGAERSQPQARTQTEVPAQAAPQAETEQPLTRSEQEALIDQRARAIAQELIGSSSESATGGITGIRSVQERRLSERELVEEIITRTVGPALANHMGVPLSEDLQHYASPAGRQEIDTMLQRHGIRARALTVAANGSVVFTEIARQFTVHPEPDVIARNHFRSIAMGGTYEMDMPRIDGGGITQEWERGETTEITTSDPTTDTFSLRMTEQNSSVLVPDKFMLFNIEGARVIGQTLFPIIRQQAQLDEDRKIFTSNGIAPNPTRLIGLRHATGVVEIVPGTNGDTYSEKYLNDMKRNMPREFKRNPMNMAYYVPDFVAEDFGQAREARATQLGDRYLEQFYNQPGPVPIGVKGGVPVYSAWMLPEDETRGTSTDCGTAILMPRDVVAIGDAVMFRLEPYRDKSFKTYLQTQHFVALGYSFPGAIVRRPGLRPAVFS